MLDHNLEPNELYAEIKLSDINPGEMFYFRSMDLPNGTVRPLMCIRSQFVKGIHGVGKMPKLKLKENYIMCGICEDRYNSSVFVLPEDTAVLIFNI